jgi:hypothetical protein
MRRSPRVRNNIITILGATALLLALAQATSANVSEEVAWGLDGRMVLREK